MEMKEGRSIVQTCKSISLSVNTQLLSYVKQISAWQYVRVIVAKSSYINRVAVERSCVPQRCEEACVVPSFSEERR